MLKANKLPTPSHCDSSRPGWHHMRAFYSMFYVEYWERFPQVTMSQFQEPLTPAGGVCDRKPSGSSVGWRWSLAWVPTLPSTHSFSVQLQTTLAMLLVVLPTYAQRAFLLPSRGR
jgi:hypothetical protein